MRAQAMIQAGNDRIAFVKEAHNGGTQCRSAGGVVIGEGFELEELACLADREMGW